MNRLTGLILAIAVGTTLTACASGGAAGGAATSGGSSAQGTRPSDNRFTREANTLLGRAMIVPDADAQRTLYQQALEQAQLSIESEPRNPRGWLLAGLASVNLGDIVGADTTFARAQELNPAYGPEIDGERENAWIAAYNEGVNALQADDLAGAIAGMENADRIYPKRPEARLNLGSFYAQQNDNEKAIDSYRRALRMLQGPEFDALDESSKADWRENEEAAALNLAQLLTSMNRSADAERTYREFLQRNPQNIPAQVSLAESLLVQGKNTEAAELLAQLTARPDLTADDFLLMGVGFFRAERFGEAADAFRKTTERNQVSRDGFFNLAQALYMHATKLDEGRQAAQGDQARAIAAQVVPVYEQLIGTTEKVLEFEPANRNILAYMARAYQNIGELSTAAPARDQARARLQDVMRRYEEALFEVDDISLRPGEGNVQITALVNNLKVPAGQQIQIRFSIYGANGNVIGSQTGSVAAPAANASADFRVTVPISGTMSGWKYELVR